MDAVKLAYRVGCHKFIGAGSQAEYGSNDRNDSMISYAMHQIKNNELAEFSHGMQMWNYLYEDDAGKIFFNLGKI